MTLYIMTLAEMKGALGIQDTRDDALLTLWMEGLQGRFDLACRRKFLYAAAAEETFDGGVSELLVKRFPIDAVASVTLDGDALSEDADDYTVDRQRGAIAFGIGVWPWPEGMQTIAVRYAGGFVKSDGTAAPLTDETDLSWLRRAMLMQGTYEWRNRETLGLASVGARGVNVQAAAGVALAGQTLLPEVETVLAPLKRWA